MRLTVLLLPQIALIFKFLDFYLLCDLQIFIKRQFIWSAKISNAYFIVAIRPYATVTLALHMLTLALQINRAIEQRNNFLFLNAPFYKFS